MLIVFYIDNKNNIMKNKLPKRLIFIDVFDFKLGMT